MDNDLVAIPKISIYGEALARRVLSGTQDGWWASAGVTGITVSAHGGGGGITHFHGGGGGAGGNSVISGSGYASGGSNAGGGGGGAGGWNPAYWTCYAYGSVIVQPGDIVKITGA